MSIPYDKPSLTLQQQIDLLISRKLVVENAEQAKNALSNAGYYHLSAYFKFYQKHETDCFVEGVTFQSIMDLYAFDRRLTLLFFDAIERIEISLRSATIEICSHIDSPYWYSNSTLYSNTTYFEPMKQKWAEDIVVLKNKDGVLKEFYGKYSNEWPPSWIFFETISFGQITKIFQNLQRSYRRSIAQRYGISDEVLLSALRGLVDIRNICAHHERLWNRKVKQRMIPAGSQVTYQNNTLFSYIIAVSEILRQASPTSTWSKRAQLLIEEKPEYQKSLGCPDNWVSYFATPNP